MSSPPEFSLLRDPWLPVTTLDGNNEEWGLREFFHRAHEARGLNEPSPLAYTAVLRLLLAIAHRNIKGPATDDAWYELWERRHDGFDTAQFDAYLSRWEHRFNLFDTEAPFGQVIDFDPETKSSPIARLILEQASGSNTTLFGHSRDDVTPSTTPAEAARALLTAHQYAFAGAGGKFMQAPMVAGYAVSWEGSTLFETLVLNLVRYGDSLPPMLGIESDLPFWEDENLSVPNKEVRAARGLTDLYTFRGRRLQLLPEEDGTVRHVLYDQGLVLDLLGENLRDPFKRYLAQKQANAQLPRNFSENRALWRDAYGLIEESQAAGAENDPPQLIMDLQNQIHDFRSELADLTPNLIATGLVNNQARISLWRMDRMSLPLTILANQSRQSALHSAIDDAESAWSNALRPAASWFATIGLVGEDQKADSNDVAAIMSRIAIEQRYWSRIDREFQVFVSNLSTAEDVDATLSSWKFQLQLLCESCFRDATHSMTGGRWYQAQCLASNYLYSKLRKSGIIDVQGEDAA